MLTRGSDRCLTHRSSYVDIQAIIVVDKGKTADGRYFEQFRPSPSEILTYAQVKIGPFDVGKP